MNLEIIVLRLIHIVGGIFWVGSTVSITLFVVPALTTSGVNAGQVFAALQRRRFFTILPLVAVLTIASGLRLIWIASGGFSHQYFATGTGRTFGLAGSAAIVAFLLGIFVARPAAARSGKLTGSLASAPEEQRARITSEVATLRRRGAVATAVAVSLLVLSAAGMAIARYVA